MSGNQKLLFWITLAILIFALFRWLFGLAIPEIALPFSVGITVVLVSGLITGRYASRLAFDTNDHFQGAVIAILAASILIGCIIIGVLVNIMIEKTEFMHFAFTVMSLFLVSGFAGALVTLVRNRIRSRIRTARVAMEHSQSELQLLQSQLSPHFLFNTLNNIYGLSISDHEKVPALLLKLSDLLRYSVYEAKETFVSLPQELEYIKNYIGFESLRLGERLQLTVNFDDLTGKLVKIPPMLLIVFVENAFKHARNTQGEKIFIDIGLHNNENEIVFSVTNSCFRATAAPGVSQKHSGFGLESVRKRLALLYPEQHNLKITESLREYAVVLRLKSK